MHSRDIVTAVLDPLEALGGGLKLAQFIALLGLFDINPDAVRATLSRMRREGLLHTEKIGREVQVPPHPQFMGALGAALFALEQVRV